MNLKKTGWSTSEYPEYARVVFEEFDDERVSDPESENGASITEPELVGTVHCHFPSCSL